MSEPRPAASAAIFDGNAVLLIRRALAPLAGQWSLPGGRAEPGEDAQTCVCREIGEELGLTLIDLRLVETRPLPGFRLSVFAARLVPGEMPRPNGEIADWAWFGPEAPLPVPHTEGLADVLARARRIVQAM